MIVWIVVIGCFFLITLIVGMVFLFIYLNKRKQTPEVTEVPKNEVSKLVEWMETHKKQIEQQQAIAQEKQELKDMEKAKKKEQLALYRATKETIQSKLKEQIDKKTWKPLKEVLRSADKGGTGIYILHNITKDKYYVGQSKQIFKRIKEHFQVEEIALDYCQGDQIEVKFLTANELDADYRLDHLEKVGIDIFDASTTGYNKNSGNV